MSYLQFGDSHSLNVGLSSAILPLLFSRPSSTLLLLLSYWVSYLLWVFLFLFFLYCKVSYLLQVFLSLLFLYCKVSSLLLGFPFLFLFLFIFIFLTPFSLISLLKGLFSTVGLSSTFLSLLYCKAPSLLLVFLFCKVPSLLLVFFFCRFLLLYC